jgi:GWxTD domain-containing protein
MIRILIFLLCLTVLIYSQRKMDPSKQISGFILSEIIYIPDGDSVSAYLSYRIPYNMVLFEKKGEAYEASYRFSFEVFDDKSVFAERHIKEGIITAANYDETNSVSNYEQDFIKLNLSIGEYKLIPSFTDIKSGREFNLKRGNIIIKSSRFYQPFVVNRKICSNTNLKLVNYEGNIPFDNHEYELLIPSSVSGNNYYAEISNNGRILEHKKKAEVNRGKLSLVRCENNIHLDVEPDENLFYITVKAGLNIREGDLTIRLLNDKDEVVFSSATEVKWYNKPRALSNRQLALQLLKNIDDEESFKYIANADKENFDSLFYDYWKKYDPTPATEFNELMNEFYSRADYAALNFRALSGKTGLESDRGKIYIKFGKPVRVERKSSQNGKMIEVWIYNNMKSFTFIDEKGTGEFNLIQG